MSEREREREKMIETQHMDGFWSSWIRLHIYIICIHFFLHSVTKKMPNISVTSIKRPKSQRGASNTGIISAVDHHDPLREEKSYIQYL